MTTIAYGALCSWWDSADKAATLENGIPCCPHCRRVLFQMPESAWWERVAGCSDVRDYRAIVEWMRGKCFTSYHVALGAFEADAAKKASATCMN